MKIWRLFCRLFVDLAAERVAEPLRVRLVAYPSVLPAAAFGGFVAWLLALPMEGFLLAPHASPWLPYFLAPHVLSLFLCSRLSAPTVAAWSRVGAPLAVVASWAAATWPAAGAAALAGAGLGAGPLVVRLGLLLESAPRPPLAAAAGLAIGNLALLLLMVAPLPRAAVLGLALTLPLVASGVRLPEGPPAPPTAPERPSPRLRHFLPFVLVFHVVSGLFYGELMPAYGRLGLPPGLELPFYAGCAFASVRVAKIRTELAPSLAVLFALAAFATFALRAPAAIALSMFAMQGAAGFMDAFVLLLLLGEDRRVAALGLGLGTVCLGILGGSLLGAYVADGPRGVGALGNGALALAVLTLYLWAHRPAAPAPAVAGPSGPAPVPEAGAVAAAPRFAVPPGLRARLSPAERSVLELVIGGNVFREVAGLLAVSESTVKTHMKRIYEKAGVAGKKALLEKLARHAERERVRAPGPGPRP